MTEDMRLPARHRYASVQGDVGSKITGILRIGIGIVIAVPEPDCGIGKDIDVLAQRNRNLLASVTARLIHTGQQQFMAGKGDCPGFSRHIRINRHIILEFEPHIRDRRISILQLNVTLKLNL